MAALLDDLRHALRTLARRPAYLLTCAGTLALVLAANAATLAVADATLLRPLPFTAGDRVLHLFLVPPGVTDPSGRNPLQQMEFARLRERVPALRRIEGFLPGERVVSGREGPQAVPGARVSAGLLDMLGARTSAGRLLLPEEEAPGHDVVLVSHAYWQRALGGSEAVGSAIVIDGVPHTVIGVLAPGVPPPFIDADLITPLVANPDPQPLNPLRSVVAFGEVAHTVPMAVAQAQAAAQLDAIERDAGAVRRGWSGGAQPVRTWLYGTAQAPALVLFAGALAVLLIATANISNLTAAQATSRAPETALRLALGASRADLVRLQLAELLIVCVAGAVPGVLVAQMAVPALLALDPTTARVLGDVTVDWRVQALTLALAVSAAAGAALLPTLHALRTDAAAVLNEGTTRVAGARTAQRLRRGLVAAQVALCLVLLMVGATMMATLGHARLVHPGYDHAQVLTAQLRLLPGAYDAADRRASLVEQLLPRLRALPGVVAAATTTNDFVPGNFYTTLVRVEGQATADDAPRTVQFRRVSPGYFAAMRIRTLAGRTVDERDAAGGQPVAVVSRSFADTMLPGGDPIGRTLRRAAADAPPLTIVGVVDDVRDVSLTRPPEPTLYLPWAQNSSTGMPLTLIVRTSGPPESLTGAVRAAVLAVDPAMPLRHVQSLDAFLADSLGPERLRMLVLAVMAALALAIASLGIYGVVQRSVAERSREFAIRLALGADARRVVTGVLWSSMADVAAGAAAGAVLGTWSRRVLAQVLAAPPEGSVGLVAAVVALLTAVALVAAFIPARGVARVHPLEALKSR